jgi:hypothetical protein
MPEIKPFSQWSSEQPAGTDQIDALREYTDYARTEYLRSGQLDEGVEQELKLGVVDKLRADGLLTNETTAEDAALLEQRLFAPKQNTDFDAGIVQDYLALDDPDGDDPDNKENLAMLRRYIATRKVNPETAETLAGPVTALLQDKALVRRARVAAVERGDLPAIALDEDDGTRSIYTGANKVAAEDLPMVARTLAGSGALDASDFAKLTSKQRAIFGGKATVQDEERAMLFANTLAELSKTDPEINDIVALAGDVDAQKDAMSREGIGTRAGAVVAFGAATGTLLIGEGILGTARAIKGAVTGEKEPEELPYFPTFKGTSPTKQQTLRYQLGQKDYTAAELIAEKLKANPLLRKRFSEEEIDKFAQDEVLKRTNYKFDSSKPESGIRELSTGEVLIAPALLAKPALFEDSLNKTALNEDQKSWAREERAALLDARAPEMLKRLSYLDDNAASAYAQAKATGQSDREFLETWMSDPKNYDAFSNRTFSWLNRARAAGTDIPLGLGALFGFEMASKVALADRANLNKRAELASLFGDDFGLGQQVLEALPQVAVDMALTYYTAGAGRAVSAAGSAALNSSKALAKFGIATLDDTALAAVRAATATGGEAATSAALREVGRNWVTRAAGNAAERVLPVALPAFTRSATSTYVSIYGNLPDDMTHEEKHKQAFGYSLAAGFATAAITAGMSSIGLGGPESLALGAAGRKGLSELTFREAKLVYEAVKNEGKAVSKEGFQSALAAETMGAYRNLASMAGKGFMGEAFEEALDQSINIALDDAASKKNTPLAEKLEQVWHAGLIGGILGGGLSLASQALPVSKSAQTRALEQRTSVLDGIAKRLSTSGAPQTASTVQRMMDEANARLNQSKKKDAAKAAAQTAAAPKTAVRTVAEQTEFKFDDPRGVPPANTRLFELVGERVYVDGTNINGIAELDTDTGEIVINFETPTKVKGKPNVTRFVIGNSKYQKATGLSLRPKVKTLSKPVGTLPAGTRTFSVGKLEYVLPSTEAVNKARAEGKPLLLLVRDENQRVVGVTVRGAALVKSPPTRTDTTITDPELIREVLRLYPEPAAGTPVGVAPFRTPTEEAAGITPALVFNDPNQPQLDLTFGGAAQAEFGFVGTLRPAPAVVDTEDQADLAALGGSDEIQLTFRDSPDYDEVRASVELIVNQISEDPVLKALHATGIDQQGFSTLALSFTPEQITEAGAALDLANESAEALLDDPEALSSLVRNTQNQFLFVQLNKTLDPLRVKYDRTIQIRRNTDRRAGRTEKRAAAASRNQQAAARGRQRAAARRAAATQPVGRAQGPRDTGRPANAAVPDRTAEDVNALVELVSGDPVLRALHATPDSGMRGLLGSFDEATLGEAQDTLAAADELVEQQRSLDPRLAQRMAAPLAPLKDKLSRLVADRARFGASGQAEFGFMDSVAQNTVAPDEVAAQAEQSSGTSLQESFMDALFAPPPAPAPAPTPAPDPAAVARRNVEPDGKIWLNGNKVDPTDDSVAEAVAAAKRGQQDQMLILKKLRALKASKKELTSKWVGENLPADASFASLDAAIASYERGVANTDQYIADIQAARDQYNKAKATPKPAAKKAARKRATPAPTPAPAPAPAPQPARGTNNADAQLQGKGAKVDGMVEAILAGGSNIDLVESREDATARFGLRPSTRKTTPIATAYVRTDGTTGLLLYPRALKLSSTQLVKVLAHERIHLDQYAFEATPEGGAAATEAESVFDKDSPNFDKKLDSLMRKEYPSWDQLPARNKLREASRAAVEGLMEGETSHFTKGLFSYIGRFLKHVQSIFEGDTAMTPYVKALAAAYEKNTPAPAPAAKKAARPAPTTAPETALQELTEVERTEIDAFFANIQTRMNKGQILGGYSGILKEVTPAKEIRKRLAAKGYKEADTPAAWVAARGFPDPNSLRDIEKLLALRDWAFSGGKAAPETTPTEAEPTAEGEPITAVEIEDWLDNNAGTLVGGTLRGKDGSNVQIVAVRRNVDGGELEFTTDDKSTQQFPLTAEELLREINPESFRPYLESVTAEPVAEPAGKPTYDDVDAAREFAREEVRRLLGVEYAQFSDAAKLSKPKRAALLKAIEERLIADGVDPFSFPFRTLFEDLDSTQRVTKKLYDESGTNMEAKGQRKAIIDRARVKIQQALEEAKTDSRTADQLRYLEDYLKRKVTARMPLTPATLVAFGPSGMGFVNLDAEVRDLRLAQDPNSSKKYFADQLGKLDVFQREFGDMALAASKKVQDARAAAAAAAEPVAEPAAETVAEPAPKPERPSPLTYEELRARYKGPSMPTDMQARYDKVEAQLGVDGVVWLANKIRSDVALSSSMANRQYFPLIGDLEANVDLAERYRAEWEPVAQERTLEEIEAEEEAQAEAIRARAEAEIDAEPLGQAFVTVRDEADADKSPFRDAEGDLKKSKIKTFANRLVKDGVLDDVEPVLESSSDRDTDAESMLDELLTLLDDARESAIDERVDELTSEAEQSTDPRNRMLGTGTQGLAQPITDFNAALREMLPAGFTLQADPNMDGALGYDGVGSPNVVYYNPNQVGAITEGLSLADAKATLRTAVDHELGHAAADSVYTPDDYQALADELGTEMLATIVDTYYMGAEPDFDQRAARIAADRASGAMPDWKIAAEWVRMEQERIVFGRTSEQRMLFLRTRPSLLAKFIESLEAFVVRLRARFFETPTTGTAASISRAARQLRKLKNGGWLPAPPAPDPNGLGHAAELYGALERGSDQTLFMMPLAAAAGLDTQIEGLWSRIKKKFVNLPPELQGYAGVRSGLQNASTDAITNFEKRLPRLVRDASQSGITLEDVNTMLGSTSPTLDEAANARVQAALDTFTAAIPADTDYELAEEAISKELSRLRQLEIVKSNTAFRTKQQEAEQRIRDAGHTQLAELLKGFRARIDKLSESFGQLSPVVNDNLNVYLTRTYRLFTTAGWAAMAKGTIAPDGTQLAMFRGQQIDFGKLRANAAAAYEQDAIAEAAKEGKVLTSDELAARTHELLDRYLSKLQNSAESLSSPSSDSLRQDLNRFLPKKNFDKAIRELLGEVKDPLENAVRTMVNVTKIAANDQFMRSTRAFLLSDPALGSTKAAKGLVPVLGHKTTNPALLPLDGIYTTPEIARALQAEIGPNGRPVESNTDSVLRQAGYGLMKASSFAVTTKTLLSVGFYSRNFVSGQGLLLGAQGIFPVNKYTYSAYGISRRAYFESRKRTPEQAAFIERLVELQIIKDDTQARVVQDLMRGFTSNSEQELDALLNAYQKAAEGDDKPLRSWLDKAGIGYEKGKAGYSKFIDILASVNNFMDGAVKIQAYQFELDVLKDAYATELAADPALLGSLEEQAAQKVKLTFPSHSQQLAITKSLTRSSAGLIVFPFVRWKTEVLRTMWNTPKLIKQELFSGNAVLRRRGARRFTGYFGTLFAGGQVLGAVYAAVFSALGRLDGDDEDDTGNRKLTPDELYALRAALPEWQKGHQLYTRLVGGEVQVIDMTAITPYAMITDLFSIAIEGAQTGEGVQSRKIAGYVAGQIIGTQIAANVASEILNNRDAFDQPIYRKTDNAVEAFGKMFGHYAKGAIEPSVVGKFKTATRFGEQDSWEIIVGEFLGARPKDHKLAEIEYRAFRSVKQLLDDSAQIKSKLVTGRALEADEVADTLSEHQDALNRTQRQLAKVMSGLQSMGSSRGAVYRSAKNAGFSNQRLSYAERGENLRWVPNTQWLRSTYENMTRTGEQDPQERIKLIRSTLGGFEPIQDVLGDQ